MDQCRTSPGVVLADNNDGHYIRYHTDCAVISNNFIQTRQDSEKIRLTTRLLGMEPEKIARDYPWITYALVRRSDNVFDETVTPEQVSKANPGIGQVLLSDDYARAHGMQVLAEVHIRRDGRSIPLARFVRLPAPAAQP